VFAEKSTIAMRNYFQVNLAGLEQSIAELSAHLRQRRSSTRLKLVMQIAEKLDLVRSPDSKIDSSLGIVVVCNLGSAKAVALRLSEIYQPLHHHRPKPIGDVPTRGRFKENVLSHSIQNLTYL
jgi:hypothetical protein